MLDVGSKAPSFLLNNQDGNPVSLNDFAGQKLLIWRCAFPYYSQVHL